MKAFSLILLVAMPGAFADDYLWLEREWISDADASMAANPEMVSALKPDVLSRYKSLFGKMRWRIADGVFTTQLPEGTQTSVTYAIRPVSADRFEIVLYGEGEGENLFVIHRTQTGFCAQPGSQQFIDNMKSENAPGVVECFKPYAG